MFKLKKKINFTWCLSALFPTRHYWEWTQEWGEVGSESWGCPTQIPFTAYNPPLLGVFVCVSHSVMFDSATPWAAGHQLLCPWDSTAKNTGVGCHSLLQGIFPTQGSNLGLLHCRQILYCLSHQGHPSDGQTINHWKWTPSNHLPNGPSLVILESAMVVYMYWCLLC